MIVAPVKKVLGLGAVLGVGGLGLYGGNELSKKTISDGLGEVKLVNEADMNSPVYSDLIFNLWNKPLPKTDRFKKVAFLEKYDESSLDDADITKHIKLLKEACEESSSEHYSSLFSRRNDDLMDDVKNFCSLKINSFVSPNREILDFSGDFYKEEEESLWINNLQGLKSLKKDLLKNSDLLEIKNSRLKNEIGKDHIDPLFKWCKRHSEEYFVSDEDDVRINFDFYCAKNKELTGFPLIPTEAS